MVNVTSWKFWVIVALALGTLACAGRRERREEQRERREQAREERRERAEQRRYEREQRYTEQRAPREAQPQQRAAEPAAQRSAPPPPPPRVQTVAAAPPPPVAAAVASDASARLVFFRPSKQASSMDAALFDVTEPGEPKFIGTITPASKFTYPLKPGLYTFMAVGETAEFMQATVDGGKTYYALVIPKSGAKRFAIEPVRQHEIGGKDFTSWDRGTRQQGDAGKPYDTADAAQKRVKHWQEDWMKKSDAQRAELTINAEDGR